ncbi:DNA replication and repair protein RecN [Caminicella sporogenes DSM 14501]|uniref:DNA repair protein RecN n=1 Tax=Caminicella sporogenes DSM 14501 TaxID=1121266 RepID=A0A1M6LL56_9FIRM|nr:DNA repair protein RecN [Caminicella sporogenes]RKD27869.1 DNA repair protein RecN [Caminicella sporogenes]SHJ71898.1 DNA replication and repair protein RecN [Caminicella sporogenes DSM 14501]
MLLELSIENFLLIDKVKISFTNGFNVISGETGAGKSIIIDAINLTLGGKSNKNFVRTGKKRAIIEAVFDIDNREVKKLLDEYGIDCEDNILILTREIFGTGKSISRVNGRIVQLAFIQKISKLLIDIHGQHEHQSLLYSENHIDLLDLYGNKLIQDTAIKVKEKYNELKLYKSELKKYSSINEKERERRIDLIKFQINEIDSSNLKNNEDEELLKEYELLKNAENIFATISESYDKISSNYNDEYSVSSVLSNVLSKLEKISSFDEKLLNFYSEVQDIFYRLQDISTDMRHYLENISFDSERLNEIEMRLDTINNLKRKYGNTIEEILNYRNELIDELKEIEGSFDKINVLNEKIKKCEEEYIELADKLTVIRKQVAKDFEEKILKELKDLNLEKAKFEVNIVANLDKEGKLIFSQKGIDKVEFLISTNPGEPLMPLSKVASGGEISRIMLALKIILAKVDNISTLIFDEIDTGISGKTANIVGEKMALIAINYQVISITHLPQIAVMADNHLLIEKVFYDDQTMTKVKTLTEEERIEEISRLIGGNNITDLTLQNAEEMIELANKIKEGFNKKVAKI